jgi:hypothetical protein
MSTVMSHKSPFLESEVVGRLVLPLMRYSYSYLPASTARWRVSNQPRTSSHIVFHRGIVAFRRNYIED